MRKQMKKLKRLLKKTILILALSGCASAEFDIWVPPEMPNGPVCTIAMGGEYSFCRDTRGGDTYRVPITSMEKYKAVSYEFWYELMIYVGYLKKK